MRQTVSIRSATLKVVGGDDQGRLGPGQRGEQHVEQMLGGGVIELPGRLVGEDQRRAVRDRPRHRDALGLPAGEFFGKFIGDLGEPEVRSARPTPRRA